VSEHYRIRVKGHLADRWAAGFDGFALTRSADGSTVLDGVVDQAALHGALRRLADLGVPLISVLCATTSPEENP
jgi:hypothetical protein